MKAGTMADQRGGYRKPTNPAPVSGPGALSKRTDGQPAQYVAGMNYGEGQDFYDLQTQAPMAKTQGAPNPASIPLNQGAALAGYSNEAMPLDAPTQYPDEPVTTGITAGPGAGPEVLASPAAVAAQNDEDAARLAALLPIYARIAESPNASNAMRNFYRYLRSQV